MPEMSPWANHLTCLGLGSSSAKENNNSALFASQGGPDGNKK